MSEHPAGVSLNAMSHPINPDSLETVEIEVPAGRAAMSEHTPCRDAFLSWLTTDDAKSLAIAEDDIEKMWAVFVAGWQAGSHHRLDQDPPQR